MSETQVHKTNHIIITPYNTSWPMLFAAEALAIKEALGDDCVVVHHVGSTSVPGLSAKPIIDIIVAVKAQCHCEARSNPVINNSTIMDGNASKIKNGLLPRPKKDLLAMTLPQVFASLGYVYKGEYNIPMHYGFAKRGMVDVNLHLYEEGHAEIELNLMFRDYLRANHSVRDEYAVLKHELLQNPDSFKKNNSMFTGYNLGKNAFISDILQKAGFNRLRMVRAVHYNEVEAAKNFRQKYFFDKAQVEDPYLWTFSHIDHEHLILYKGTVIVGYVHLQWWPEHRVAMRIIVVDENKRNMRYGSEFIILIERYLRSKGYKSVHAESTPEALGFYQKHGYSEMPFNDPDDHQADSTDIAIGKIL